MSIDTRTFTSLLRRLCREYLAGVCPGLVDFEWLFSSLFIAFVKVFLPGYEAFTRVSSFSTAFHRTSPFHVCRPRRHVADRGDGSFGKTLPPLMLPIFFLARDNGTQSGKEE